jgi:ferric-dicitrate binding protein FerR (iron transport regulator)
LAPLTSVTVTSAAIRVSGEAYFDIASGAARAIVVHTPNAVVRVLGTQFSVRHYAGDVESRIVVVTGKVGVQSWTGASQRRQPVVVGAQSVARITDSTVSVSRGIAPAEYLAWTRDRLIFDQTPLHDVVTELNRVYDVDIRVADTLLAKQPLMMDVSIAHKPVADILTLIGRATGSHYRRDGRVFMLIPGRTVVPSEHSAPLHRDLYLKEKSYGK